MLNPEVKVSCRPHHNRDISTTRKTMDNKFFICENIKILGYLGARGGGLHSGGGGLH